MMNNVVYKVIALSALLVLSACEQDISNTTAVGQTGSVAPQITFVSKTQNNTSAKDYKSKTINFGGSTLPSDLATVRLTISGSFSGSPITADFAASARSGTLTNIPVSSGNTLEVLGLDSGNVTRYRAVDNNVSVSAGSTTSVPVVAVGTSPIVDGYARYVDVDNSSTINVGDHVIVTFDQEVTLNSASDADFLLPVTGDSFGAGATVAAGLDPKEVIITLGTAPVLNVQTIYNNSVTTAGSASGIDVSASVSGISASTVNNTLASSSTPVDIVGTFPANYAAPTSLTVSTDNSRGVALGDLNNDGHVDIFIAKNGQANQVFTGVGDGTFSDTGQSLGSFSSYDVELGDVDGDGDLDAIVANNPGADNTLYLNDGASTFTQDTTFNSASSFRDTFAIAIGDLDGDGDLDYIEANGSGWFSVSYDNDGSGSFSSHDFFNSNTDDTRDVALGDVDNDGDLDVIFGNYTGVNSTVYTNDGSGNFTDSGQSLGSSSTHGVALGDVDGDGDLDVVLANNSSEPNEVYLNNGLGGFANSLQSLGTNNSTAVALRDIDGDGDLDAIFTNNQASPSPTQVYLNDGAGDFSTLGQSLGDSSGFDLAIADIQNDGDLDVVVANSGSDNTIYLNQQPNIPPTASAGADQTVVSGATVTLAGVASDGDGAVASILWTQLSGTPVTFDDATIATPTFTAPSFTATTTADFQITVTDDDGATSSDTVTITISGNNAPTANAGVDQTVQTGSLVYFDGFGTDPDGSIASFSWSQVSGTPVSIIADGTANARFVAPLVTTSTALTFRLTVTDDANATGTDDVVFTVTTTANVGPTVDAGPDRTVQSGATVAFAASGTDPDDGISSYLWEQTGGQTVTLTGSTSIMASFTAPTVTADEILTFRLTATDSVGAASSDEVAITVTTSATTNTAPTVDTSNSTPTSAEVGNLVTLDGTLSTDSDGTIASYQWVQISGTPVVLTGSSTATATFTAPYISPVTADNDLTFILYVMDDLGAVSSGSVIVNVAAPLNVFPTANAGLDQTVNDSATVTLYGAGSDVDGTISYSWTQISGTAVTISSPTFANASFNAPTVSTDTVLTFRLTVTDDDLDSATDDVNVTVTASASNQYPTVSAGEDRIVQVGKTVLLNATASDPDGTIASYNWTQIAGRPVILNNASSITASFTAPAVGINETFTFRVTATDDTGAVAVDDVVITVSTAANIRPIADAGVDQTAVSTSTVTLYGSGKDTDGNIASYLWQQTSGQAVTLSSTTLQAPTFTAPTVTVDETLGFRLTVTDNGGATSTDDVVVTVTASSTNVAPTVNAGVDQTASYGTDVYLEGFASDSDGSIASYQWTQIGGTTVALFNATTPSANFVVPTLTPILSEQLTFRLTVTDDSGFIANDEVIVTASSVVNVAPVADAGLDQTVQTSTLVTLDGSGSSDSDGTITYTWTQISGNPVTLDTTIPSAPTFTTDPTTETYIFRLTVTDNDNAISVDDVTVTSSDLPFITTAARYYDNNFDGVVNANDTIELTFDQNIVTTSATIADLNLPVTGDDFGTGATITSVASSNIAVITLGTSPNIRIGGVYTGDTQYSPSGIAVASGNTGIQNTTLAAAIASAPVDIVPAYVDSGQTIGTSSTRDIVLGDIDADGDLDMVDVALNETTSTHYVNDGSGAFSFDQSYAPTARASQALILGDLDGDFDLDLFVANGGADFSKYYLYNGSNFTEIATNISGSNTLDAALGDIDGDGDLDAVLANIGANQVFLNTGSGISSTASFTTTSTVASSGVALGDIDGDGDLDVVFANQSFTANQVYTNDGTGNLTDSSQALGSADSKAVALADLDGDSDLDMIVANSTGQANKVYFNDGTGAFTDSGQSLGSSNSFDVKIVDADADGDKDLVFANDGGQGNTIFFNNGSGVFTDSKQSLGSNDSISVAVGDVDGDGDEDLAFANDTSTANTVYLNSSPKSANLQGSAKYLDKDLDGTVSLNDQIIVSFDEDVDGSNADVTDFSLPVSGDSFGTGAVLSAGPASNELTITLGTSPSLTLLLDYSGTNTSGSPSGIDIVSSNKILTASANGEAATRATAIDITPAYLESSVTYGTSDSRDIALGDLDGDGDTDMVVANTNGQANQIYLNDSGTFTLAAQTLGNSDSVAVALADIDSDGDLDIAFANAGAQSNTVYINSGTNPPLFADASLTVGSGAVDVAFADLTNDDAVDLIFTTSSGQDIYYANNSGTYSTQTSFGLNSTSKIAMALGDIDGDGDIDMMTAVSSGSSFLYKNFGQVGAPTFSSNFITSLSGITDVALADVDGDNDLDIIFARNSGLGNLVFINSGFNTGTFNDSLQSLGTSNSTGVVAVDMDGDADLDLVFSNDNDAANTVFINDGSGKFTDSGLAFGAASSHGLAAADLDGDGGQDVVVANGGAVGNSVYYNSSPLYVEATPVFSSGTAVSANEGSTGTGYTAVATDANPGDSVAYSISGGADAAEFSIDPTTGVLIFITAPDFEAPADADTNNTYVVDIDATDGKVTATQTVTVTVNDVLEVTKSLGDPRVIDLAWSAPAGATNYKLKVNPDGVSGYTLDTDSITTTSTSIELSVHLTDWVNATYVVEAYDGVGTKLQESAPISITAEMLGAIGYFKAGNVTSNDYFGWAVSLSDDGSTLAVGAYAEDGSANTINGTVNDSFPDSGAVYVFAKSGTTWTQQAYIKPSNIGSSDNFGFAVSLSADGNRLAVGARYEDGQPGGVTTPDTLDGLLNAGAAYVFSRSGATWTQDAYIKASNPGSSDYFGSTIDISADGNTLAVGAHLEDSSSTGINSTPNEVGTNAGAVYVFKHNGTAWSQEAYVKPSIISAGDFFGYSVSLSSDGNTLAVGSILEDSTTTGINSTPNEVGTSAGAAYVFTRSGSTWTQQAYIKASNVSANDEFGHSVSLSADGNTLAVGSPYEDGSASGVNSTPNESLSASGAAYVFRRSGGTTWSQEAYVKASSPGNSDIFGLGVAISPDGNTLAVGAHAEDSNSTGINGDELNNLASAAGAVYVYEFDSTNWSQSAYVKAINPTANDNFGYEGTIALSADGKTLAIGAHQEDSNTTGINSTPNDFLTNTGAIYLY